MPFINNEPVQLMTTTKQDDKSIAISNVTPDMLDDLLSKINILEETGFFEIDYDTLNKLENYRIYVGYFLSLKKYADLKKLSEGRNKPSYLVHLENFKRGLLFLLRIPDNKMIIPHMELRKLGKYLKKNGNDNSSELEDIVKAWAKYRYIAHDAIMLIEKKHNGYIDFYKNIKDILQDLLIYILENSKNINHIIELLNDGKPVFVKNTNNFYQIVKRKEENSFEIQLEDFPLYVLATMLEGSKRGRIEELDILNTQKNARKQIETIEITPPQIEIENEITSDAKDDFFDNDITDPGLDTTMQNSKFPTLDLGAENKISLFVGVIDITNNYKSEIKNAIKNWERFGINDNNKKTDVIITLLAYIEELSEDLDKNSKERVDAFLKN